MMCSMTICNAYISMNPVQPAVFVPEVPPLQHEACSTFKMDEKLYAEIPGEYLPVIKGEDSAACEHVQYGSIPPFFRVQATVARA